MYSLVISTIGCPFLLDSLGSLTHPPDDIIVVLDRIGRRTSTLDTDYPLPQLERDMAERFPAVRLLYNDPVGPWGVHNQCYNVGWRNARRPFVWFTHDDVEYPAFNFPRTLNPVLREVSARNVIDGRSVVGLVLPEYETVNGVTVPAYPDGSVGLTQCVSPVSQVVSVAAMRELGGFDEVNGIWYDGHLQAETFARDWWYLLLATPKLRHTSNRTYRANNWGDGWQANPIWNHHQQNFQRRYGHIWARYIAADEPIAPLHDERFTALVPC